ncbi:DUF2163 domain-containing protein [Neogemmobacter tilapiae]|uniref:Bacteriophage phiJL001 Gp84 C-terminal domain-containing protein n=1 Tax=Neogemmobacter tilapiae TaxID=875041 RepID=A0A918TIA3_9RHOB|nr:DUF2163 domain-containing protein [Gemmobacter tilapiae]GHC46251.1 hypothetical protein GCM10007315_04900 [Gemmobacter tilapiae]
MGAQELYAHLGTGATTVCRAWSVTRGDGVVLGFTDHDRDLAFGGIAFKASTGMTAQVLQQTTGLSENNSEAVGALSDASISEGDLLAGRFDGARVKSWLVNWADVSQRVLQFRGSFGEISRSGGAFRAELRGLSELMNQPRGRAYQKECSAVLGDGQCKVDLENAAFGTSAAVVSVDGGRVLRFAGLGAYANRWFERGRVVVQTGAAAGLIGLIKNDRKESGLHEVELWQALGIAPRAGDTVRIEAGCDKRAATCKAKFSNFNNFRGFPHIPGEDWLQAFPSQNRLNDGGRLGD